MSNSLQTHGLWPARLPCPWNSPGKNAGVGNHSFLQDIFLTQGSNPSLLHCRQTLSTKSPGKTTTEWATQIQDWRTWLRWSSVRWCIERLERRWHRDGSMTWALKGQRSNDKQIQVSGCFARTLAGRDLDGTPGARQAPSQESHDHGSRLTLGPDRHPQGPSLFKSNPLLNSPGPVRCQDWKRKQFTKLRQLIYNWKLFRVGYSYGMKKRKRVSWQTKAGMLRWPQRSTEGPVVLANTSRATRGGGRHNSAELLALVKLTSNCT